ncbi:MAG: hypothetical protein AABW90_00810 [Nanoarchaeota archaeon]
MVLEQITRDVRLGEMYKLIIDNDVKVGDRFRVNKSGSVLCITEEIVFDVISGRCINTMVYTFNDKNVSDKFVGEFRYMGLDGYSFEVNAYKRNSKDYHKLLEEIK